METVEKKTIAWNADAMHSKIQFAVRHMVISEVTGQFNKFDLKVETAGDDFADAQVDLTIDVASIDTGIEDRNNHLKSPDFIDLTKYPNITFKSTDFKKVDDENYLLTGDLTMNGVTKPIEFKVEFGGKIIDGWGFHRAGFKVEGSIDRFDYNLKWNDLLETGGAVVSKKVKLTADIELVHK